MLISRERGLLFVHIQKTGGQSIERLLKRHVPDVARYLGTHDPARAARHEMGPPRWDTLFKFAFVRNPWDRLLAWYMMIQQHGGVRPWSELNELWKYVLVSATTFEEFLARCTMPVEDTDGVKSFTWNQFDYLTDESGDLIVDFVGRYETFASDVEEVARRLAIRDYTLPHVNRSRHSHYSHYYNEHTKQLVADRFAKDIDQFGYCFETR